MTTNIQHTYKVFLCSVGCAFWWWPVVAETCNGSLLYSQINFNHTTYSCIKKCILVEVGWCSACSLLRAGFLLGLLLNPEDVGDVYLHKQLTFIELRSVISQMVEPFSCSYVSFYSCFQDDETEFSCKLSRLVNGIGLNLIDAYNK
jgi:hypothetical protein